MEDIDQPTELDEDVPLSRGTTQRMWERNARSWWLNGALAVACALAAVVWDLRGLVFMAPAAAFSSGFFYSERLRLLGRRSRLPGYRAPG